VSTLPIVLKFLARAIREKEELKAIQSQIIPICRCYDLTSKNSNKNLVDNWALLAYTYNCSYSGGKDLEDRGSKPVQANSS
jgi:hypothetical protein